MNRAEHRRHKRDRNRTLHVHVGHIAVDTLYGTQCGWFRDLADIEEAKRATHDALINQMGARRSGPVEWRYWEGDEAKKTLATYAGVPATTVVEGEAEYFAEIGRRLDEFGGYFIVALAKGAPS